MVDSNNSDRNSRVLYKSDNASLRVTDGNPFHPLVLILVLSLNFVRSDLRTTIAQGSSPFDGDRILGNINKMNWFWWLRTFSSNNRLGSLKRYTFALIVFGHNTESVAASGMAVDLPGSTATVFSDSHPRFSARLTLFNNVVCNMRGSVVFGLSPREGDGVHGDFLHL